MVGEPHAEVFQSVKSLQDLRDAPWIWPSADLPVRLAAERVFSSSGLSVPTNLVESLSILTNIGLLIESPCVALMPSGAAGQFIGAGLLHQLQLPDIGKFGTVGYSVRADKEVTPACKALIDCLNVVVGRN